MSVASGLQESRSRELAEIEFLRAENERLQQDLDECKSKLLQVFREEGQATDSDIQNDFERLSNAVEAWVDLVLDQHAVSFRKEWEKVMQQTHLRKDAPGIVEFLRDAFPSGFGPGDAMGWLGAQKSADCLIVSIVVWQVLEQIFRRRWPVGTNDNRAKRKDQGYDRRSILDNVQNAMLNEGNRKDPFSKAIWWKSEALVAMARLPSFKWYRQEEASRILCTLTDCLLRWVPITDHNISVT